LGRRWGEDVTEDVGENVEVAIAGMPTLEGQSLIVEEALKTREKPAFREMQQ